MKLSALGSYTRLSAALGVMLILTACASSGDATISKIPSRTGDITSADGRFTQPIKWEKTKAGCKGQCPRIKVDSVVFPGNALLTKTVDATLASMTGIGDGPLHHTVQEFEQHFWKVAGPRDEVILSAHPRYRNKDLTVLELGSWQYLTGGAHGISSTQFLNWDNQQASLLRLDDILLPGQKTAFEEVLKQAHHKWLLTQETALEDMAQYNRLWPFQPTDNIALTDTGVVAKYNSYEIAPYSSGQPELLIPYSQLSGILKPSFLPR